MAIRKGLPLLAAPKYSPGASACSRERQGKRRRSAEPSASLSGRDLRTAYGPAFTFDPSLDRAGAQATFLSAS